MREQGVAEAQDAGLEASSALLTPVSPLPAVASLDCPTIILEVFGELAGKACAIAWCESRWHPGAVGDSGRSLGWFQLWTGWAAWYGVEVDALMDAETNTRVALAVYLHRGRFGGSGGWTCATILGIF